jgi:hypothetical protein
LNYLLDQRGFVINGDGTSPSPGPHQSVPA